MHDSYPGEVTPMQIRQGCSLHLLGVKNMVLVPLRVFTLKRSKFTNWLVPFRVLSPKNMTGENVLC